MTGRAMVILLISGLAGATLVRIAPGFGIEEQSMDPRLSPRSLEVLERDHRGERNPIEFYARFLAGLFQGRGLKSILYGQPAGQLIRDRFPTTVRSVSIGLVSGWIAALLLAIACATG